MVLADHQPGPPPAMLPAAAPFFDPTLSFEFDTEFGTSNLDQLPTPDLDYILGFSSIPPPGWEFRLLSDGVDSPAHVPDTLKFAGQVQSKEGRDMMEETAWLLPVVKSRGGIWPELLYEKKLKKADLEVKDRNRVLLTRGGKEMITRFLREEEAAAVNGGGNGLTVMGFDGGGNVYENLVLKKWGDGVIVIRSDWGKVVEENKAEENDVMKIWGFRENGKPRLAFKFRREKQERGGDGGDKNVK